MTSSSEPTDQQVTFKACGKTVHGVAKCIHPEDHTGRCSPSPDMPGPQSPLQPSDPFDRHRLSVYGTVVMTEEDWAEAKTERDELRTDNERLRAVYLAAMTDARRIGYQQWMDQLCAATDAVRDADAEATNV